MRSIENNGGLLVWAGTNNCLGYLMSFSGKGVFEPNVGKVEVSKEDADTHNAVLDEMMLKGMDENCEVGQGNSFYVTKRDGKTVISTFLGTVVSDNLSINGRSLTFVRKGKKYRGRMSQQHDLFNFRRVA